ncbi:MAG: RmlC-like cupin domain-containing protein, partial [Podila humilis]
ADGVGTIVQRTIGGDDLESLDPFLTLDEFRMTKPTPSKGSKATSSKKEAGFPDHPHRGFETVTLMLEGHFQHQDFTGRQGTIGPGDVQWMTAGRGIVHAEMPYFPEESGKKNKGASSAIWGLQLWVNLPKKHKLCKPQYQDLKHETTKKAQGHDESEGVSVKVIAGESHGVASKVYTRTPTMYLEIKMQKNKRLTEWIPKEYDGFVYVLQGKARFGSSSSNQQLNKQTVVEAFQRTSFLDIETTDESCHFVLIAGEPCREPVFRQGPFVMNSKEELERTFRDYEEKKRGFERAKDWVSTI